MTLKLPRATDPTQVRHNQILENEDIRNRKMGSDLELGSERLILRSPNGTRYQVIAGDGGGVSVAPATLSGNAAAAAWTTFAATLTPNTGTITQTGTAAFIQMGKTVFISIDVTVSAVTGPPASATIALPVAPKRSGNLSGAERITTFKAIRVNLPAGGSNTGIIRDAGGVAWVPVVGDNYVFTGVYEAA